jgi:hypothetical protein
MIITSSHFFGCKIFPPSRVSKFQIALKLKICRARQIPTMGLRPHTRTQHWVVYTYHRRIARYCQFASARLLSSLPTISIIYLRTIHANFHREGTETFGNTCSMAHSFT